MREKTASHHQRVPERRAHRSRAGTLAAAAFALECIFLHPTWADPSDGGVDAAPTAAMSPEMEAQAALARALGPKVVEIEHVPADAIGAAWPIQGVWVARDRVVTAFFAVAGWAASGQRLQVVAGDRRFEAAVGLQDARIGLAVLDVPGLGMPPGGPVAGVAGAKPLLLLHAVQLGGLRRVPLVGFADGERAYYLKAVGAPLPLGAPLFDGAGRWVSLVGLRSEDPSLAGYVLPADAVRRLLAREVEWLP